MGKLGLVTVLYKSDDVLEGFFKSLSLQEFTDYHLYLIDNSPCSTTESLVSSLVNKYPITGYTHIKNDQNIGVANGNNQGIERSLNDNCEYVLLLNNDIEFYQPFLIGEMIKYAEDKNEEIIIPKIFYFGTRTIWMAGGKTNTLKAISSHIGLDKEDCPEYNAAAYFDYAPTCFMLISRKTFNAAGMMDGNYFVYYDDTDFIFRAVNKGFRIYYLPNLEVFHKVSSSTGGKESLFAIYYLNRNRVYFIRKNLSFPTKHIALVYTILTRVLRYFKYKSDQRKQLMRGVRDGFDINVGRPVTKLS